MYVKLLFWAVGRSENPGVPVLFGGHNLPPLVEIGLTDLPKSGVAMAPPAPPGTTGLASYIFAKVLENSDYHSANKMWTMSGLFF